MTFPATTNPAADPLADAMNAQPEGPRERTYFGEVVTVDAWFCVLQKGVGKRPFDPISDPIDQRRTVIKIEVQPLKGDFLISQEMLTFEAGWTGRTLPSLRKVQADLNTLKGRYVQVKRVGTGQTYTNKAGETKERTALVFERMFADGAECVQASEAFFAQFAKPSSPDPDAKVTVVPLPNTSAAEPAMSSEQKFALSSLPALWKASGNNPLVLQTMIDNNPLINKHYPFNHPEVQKLVAAVAPSNDEDLPF